MRLLMTDGRVVRVYECMRHDKRPVRATVAEMVIEGPEQALSPADIEWLRTQEYRPPAPT